MPEVFVQLQRRVERDMTLLDGLETVRPSEDCKARMLDALQREATRLRGRRRLARAAQRLAAVAAAVLLVVFLRWPLSSATDMTTLDADAYVSAWVAAADESDDRLATLLSAPWKPVGRETWTDDEAAFDDVLNSLDLSLGDGT